MINSPSDNYISNITLFFNVFSSCVGSALFFGPSLMVSTLGSDIKKIFTVLFFSCSIMILIQIFLIHLSKNFNDSLIKTGGLLTYITALFPENKLLKYLFVFNFVYLYNSSRICVLTTKIIEDTHINIKYGGIFIVSYYLLAFFYLEFLIKYEKKISKILLTIQAFTIVSLIIILSLVSIKNINENSSSFLFNVGKNEKFNLIKYVAAIINSTIFFNGVINFTFLDNSKFKNIALSLILGTLATFFLYIFVFILYFLASPYNCIVPSLLTNLSTYFSINLSYYIVSILSLLVYSFPIFNICLVSIKTVFAFENSDKNDKKTTNNERKKEIFTLKNKNFIYYLFCILISIAMYYLEIASLLIITLSFTFYVVLLVLSIGVYLYPLKKKIRFFDFFKF